MEVLAEQIGRARLGPVPLAYIFAIALIPLWTSFSSHENSLLFSMCVIITVLVKGSLLSCWILYRATSGILRVALVSCVMIAQIILLQFSLHASLFSLIILVPPSTFTGLCIFKLHLCDRADDKCEDPVPGPRSRQVIGIFSRNAQEEYAWLASMLRRVGTVVSFSITNSNYQQFTQQVTQCTFAILYHSKTRGRLNITNVTDSLYDEELKYMSQALGKSNVIVVADDLDDSGPMIEKNILTKQPSIAQLTSGLHLFTTKEKMDGQLMEKKVKLMYNMISKGWTIEIVSDLVLVFLVIAPWFFFIYSIYHVIFLITTNLNGSFLVYYAARPPTHRDSVLPSTHPIQRQRNSPHSRGTKKGARLVGLAAVLVLMVVELSSLYWVTSSMNMSLGTGTFTLKLLC
ncbi:uncharacterized protein LOC142656101 isoform X2 [Rhinoderma darwinii]|uniref:uncharacterized protein LOC142656101 isoform X2 n=1 Tax=Rhinoderma darwinii TaxID=43563 RepID=UPI003F67C355